MAFYIIPAIWRPVHLHLQLSLPQWFKLYLKSFFDGPLRTHWVAASKPVFHPFTSILHWWEHVRSVGEKQGFCWFGLGVGYCCCPGLTDLKSLDNSQRSSLSDQPFKQIVVFGSVRTAACPVAVSEHRGMDSAPRDDPLVIKNDPLVWFHSPEVLRIWNNLFAERLFSQNSPQGVLP